MRISILGLGILGVLVLLQPAPAAQQSSRTPSANEPLILSLRDAIEQSLENNLGLDVERYNPEIQESEIVVQSAQFDPGLRLEVTGGKSIRPSASAADVAILGAGAVSPIRSTRLVYSLGLEQRWVTGTRYSLSWDVSRQGGPSTVFNPNFASRLSLNVTQPLMKGFGTGVNRTELILARNNYSVSREDLEEEVAGLVADVEETYWDLVFGRKVYKVQEMKRMAAQELLAINQAKVDQGLIAPIEVLVAESAVADREEDILSAEKRVRDAEDRLRQAMNMEGSLLIEEIRIIPLDEPSTDPFDTNLEQAVEVAFEHRRDLRKARLEIRNQEQRVLQTKNGALPALDLIGTAGLAGLGDSYQDDLDRLASGDFYSWEVGMVFSMPLGNRAARTAFNIQKLEARKAAAGLRSLEQDVVIEIKEAVRRVETDLKRIRTAGRSRALSEVKLETEMERLRLGLATSQNVLEYQTDLADAQSRELKAITDYNKSLTRLARAQGTLIRDRGIVMDRESGRRVFE